MSTECGTKQFFEIRQLAVHKTDIQISSLRNKKEISRCGRECFYKVSSTNSSQIFFVVHDETTKSIFLERRNFSAATAVNLSTALFRGNVL